MEAARTARIRALNDRLRQVGAGGRLAISPGVTDKGPDFMLAAIATIALFDSFNADNDPYDEHDTGALEIFGQWVFWRIDYLDPTLMFGPADAGDPSACTRVLNIMLAAES